MRESIAHIAEAWNGLYIETKTWIWIPEGIFEKFHLKSIARIEKRYPNFCEKHILRFEEI